MSFGQSLRDVFTGVLVGYLLLSFFGITPMPREYIKRSGVTEYRAFMSECLKDPIATREICDTIFDKDHGYPQGPL